MVLSCGVLKNAEQIALVFDHLEEITPFQSIDEFLTELAKGSELADITTAVRDVMMNRTFSVILSHFHEFYRQDWIDWFTVKLTVLLPSFNAEMLSITLSYVNCTDYQVIVFGMDKVFPEMTSDQIKEITTVLVAYLKEAIFQKHDSACQLNAQNHAEWLYINLGNFSGYVNYSELKVFNITWLQSLATLSPAQTAEMLLSSGTLNNTSQIDAVFDHLEIGNPFQNVDEFLTELAQSPTVSTSSCKCKIH
ncbi:uncharacterized protein LOC125742358 [Brienomyrus brachyistius]|uniref:uncharacterized protein LOC125742358 n=1 Tax=Brienomyrus brachyistius TaxID=42636 RepID=UPI0020B37F7B|nr:uncharacterized protein LOC125742358 [Brienomyrus brachyistius]